MRHRRTDESGSPSAAPSLGRVGSPWTVLAWAALLVAIVVSLRPAVPVIWGDTPAFVESALQTLEAGTPTVAGGRDPGYPVFLAATFALGGDFATVVRLQQAAWVVLMLVLAAATLAATRNAAALVPIILVATYPGLLLLRNVLTADLLFAVFLNLAMAGLLVAACIGKTVRGYAVAAAVLCAALAACFRSQGILVPIAAILVGARLAWPDTQARRAVMAISVASALALLAAGSRLAASESDQASVVFVPKTLFCNHLNIVLASDAARREIASAAGDRADAMMARLAVDFAADPGHWRVLGFFGDACLFDTALDRDVAGGIGNADAAAAAYQRIFLAALRDRPLAYAGKFVRQMTYGASVAWPTYGLDPDAARPSRSADRSARRTRSDRPLVRFPRPLRRSIPGIVHRLRDRHPVLDGHRCAAPTLRVRDARGHRDRDVGRFGRDRGRRSYPRRDAISGSRGADGRDHVVTVRRRTGRDDRRLAEKRHFMKQEKKPARARSRAPHQMRLTAVT
jgi:hypothetical protein